MREAHQMTNKWDRPPLRELVGTHVDAVDAQLRRRHLQHLRDEGAPLDIDERGGPYDAGYVARRLLRQPGIQLQHDRVRTR